MTNSWKDLDILGRRNNKIIKYMETLLFKTKKNDPDTIVHYATAIGNLSRQNIEIIKIVTLYDEVKQKHDEDMKEIRQQEAILKKWDDDELKRKKNHLHNEIIIKKNIEREAKVAREEEIKFNENNTRHNREKMKGEMQL